MALGRGVTATQTTQENSGGRSEAKPGGGVGLAPDPGVPHGLRPGRRSSAPRCGIRRATVCASVQVSPDVLHLILTLFSSLVSCVPLGFGYFKFQSQ